MEENFLSIFFPGFDKVFSEADGVTDIDLTLKGTTRTPYLDGNVYFHAPHLHLKKFYSASQER